MARSIPWTRLLVESGLIILSILAAFGIDAAWESRGDREREAEVLAQISDDFTQHRAAIDQTLSTHRDRAQAAAEMLEDIGPRSEITEEQAVGHINRIDTFNGLVLQPGMLETVLSTEGLSVIQDPVLRDSLMRWSRRSEAVMGVQDFVISEARALADFLHPITPNRRARSLAGVEVAASDFEWDTGAAFREPEFENLVWRQAFASTALANRLELLAQLTGQVVDQISGR